MGKQIYQEIILPPERKKKARSNQYNTASHSFSILIDEMDEEMLIEVNRQIIERLRFLRQIRINEAMIECSPGERVSFMGRHGLIITGVVIRRNQKTVAVMEDNGNRWNVSPALIRK